MRSKARQVAGVDLSGLKRRKLAEHRRLYAAVAGAGVLALSVWIWAAAAVRQSASWRPKAD